MDVAIQIFGLFALLNQLIVCIIKQKKKYIFWRVGLVA